MVTNHHPPDKETTKLIKWLTIECRKNSTIDKKDDNRINKDDQHLPINRHRYDETPNGVEEGRHD